MAEVKETTIWSSQLKRSWLYPIHAFPLQPFRWRRWSRTPMWPSSSPVMAATLAFWRVCGHGRAPTWTECFASSPALCLRTTAVWMISTELLFPFPLQLWAKKSHYIYKMKCTGSLEGLGCVCVCAFNSIFIVVVLSTSLLFSFMEEKFFHPSILWCTYLFLNCMSAYDSLKCFYIDLSKHPAGPLNHVTQHEDEIIQKNSKPWTPSGQCPGSPLKEKNKNTCLHKENKASFRNTNSFLIVTLLS